MQLVKQPSVETTTSIGDRDNFARRSVDVNPRVPGVIQLDTSRRVRERVGTSPVSIILGNELNSEHTNR